MIQTSRLNLLPLTLPDLQALDESTAALEEHLGLEIAAGLLVGNAHRAVQMKITRMQAAPAQLHAWLTYWLIIIRNVPVGVGLVGYKGAPDANGAVEIGYGIDPAYQGSGYMTEAVRGLVKWAFKDPTCTLITATQVRTDNFASQRVLQKIGMQQVGESSAGFNYVLHVPDFIPYEKKDYKTLRN